MNDLHVVVLAGGLGKRMESSLPKVLHLIQNKPMCVHVLENANCLKPKTIYMIVGKYKQIIKETIQKYICIENIVFVEQESPLGTGHALLCARLELMKQNPNDKVLVLCGDVPLLSHQTMRNMTTVPFSKVSLLTTTYENPHGYGRIIKNKDNVFQKIVEEKDCTHEQKEIKLVNGGVYCFQLDLLCRYLPEIKNENKQQEYYLTDIFELIQQNIPIQIVMIYVEENKNYELTGINTKKQLQQLHEKMLNCSAP